MKTDLPTDIQSLGFVWTSTRSRNTSVCRGLVHCGPRECFVEFLRKLVDTGRVASKYYVMFHIVPLILRLKKTKDMKTGIKQIAKSIYEYVRSICFMAFLVGLLRAGLCVNWNQSQKNLVSFYDCIAYSSPISAGSILFEDISRRTQITYYVSAKAIRSLYLMVKRTVGIPARREVYVMHMAVMAALYYVYNHTPQNLKFRDLLAQIFDDE